MLPAVSGQDYNAPAMERILGAVLLLTAVFGGYGLHQRSKRSPVMSAHIVANHFGGGLRG
jgi:hypothetical protein